MEALIPLAFVVLTGWLAARKNRNRWTWGLFGMFPIFALLILAFMPYLCPKCRQSLSNKEWENRTCPTCGDLSKRD